MAEVASTPGKLRRSKRSSFPAPDTTDPVEIAMMRASESPQATSLLEKQAQLIDAHEALARADLRHRGWQILGERVGATLKGLTVLAGVLVLTSAGAVIWSAARADGIVVEPFAVPPDLERRGFSGSVVAVQLLDRITAIEASTESARNPSSYANSWSEDSDVEVPYTGMSLGQLRRELRDWLGSEKRLSGEVVRLNNQRVAINFRTGRDAGRVEGSEADLDGAIQQAALAIFKSTNPYRYTVWLGRNEPLNPERRQILVKLSRSSDVDERAWGLHGLALDASSDAQSVALYERALRLRPDFLSAIGNLPFYAANAGKEEEAYQLSRRAAVAFQAGQADYNPAHAAGYGKDAEARNAIWEGDLLKAARLRTSAIEDAADAGNAAARPYEAAAIWALLHDYTKAQAILEAAIALDADAKDTAEAAAKLQQPGPALLRAQAVGDHAVEATELKMMIDRIGAAMKDPLISGSERRASSNLLQDLRSQLALALARSGRAYDAEAILRMLPPDRDATIRSSGLVAAHLGRTEESDVLLARAAARTPSLPAAHAVWAQALLVRGEYKRAIGQAKLANKKGPSWAEPLKTWGDALMRQREFEEAAGRYQAAVVGAPRWGALHIELGRALWLSGKRVEARAAFRAAASMDLSTSDRARLNQITRAAKA
jgi:tetratricopeptide (TPR) repeat protein